jgi:hypothetical protein
MLATLIGAGLGWFFVAQSFAATFQVPATIAADCSIDVTTALSNWIASVPNNTVVSFPSNGCYRIDGTLQLNYRSGLDFEGNGSTFSSSTQGDGHRAHWRAVGGGSLTFRNMKILGGSNAGGSYVATLQWQHAFDLNGVAGVEIDHVSMSDLYGDCVYVGLGWDSAKSWSSDVYVHDSACARNGRQGVAIVAGRNVTIENNSLAQIALNAFDIEPNGTGFGAKDVTIRGNHVSGALNKSFFAAIGDGPVDYVSVANNTMSGAGMYMAVIAPAGQRRSNISITGNSSDTGYSSAGSASIDVQRVDGITITGNSIPLSASNMVLAAISESCAINVSGNIFLGGLTEVRISPYTCTAPSPSPTPTASPSPTPSPTPSPSPSQSASTTPAPIAAINSPAPSASASPALPAAPTVSITSPSNGARLAGTRAKVSATGGAGVTKIEIYIDGVLRESASSASITYTWNIKRTPSGTHTITARAYSPGGTTSASISVTK